jgi:D-alanyl-D-alanine carboxypeptidase (penicillin-binding protein 5/6)
MKRLFLITMIFFSCFIVVKADDDLTPNSKSAILIEASTGTVIYEKNSKEKLPPASMTKVMSMLLIMEAIDNGKISLSDEVTVSPSAAAMGGSQIFLQAGEKYKLEELLKGVAIASGNDAVVAIAEHLAGSVDKFVNLMNKKAKELKLTNTNFANPHGLDDENHYTTAKDMATIAKQLVKYEKILEYTSIYEYYMPKSDGSKSWLVNTNKLVRFYEGLDGLKTGFTNEAKYCLTATAKKQNMRLISVVMGAETSDLRSADTVNLLNYGFNSYKLRTIYSKNKPISTIKINKSKKEKYKTYLKEDATILEDKTDNNKKIYSYELYLNKLNAPLKKNDIVGKVTVLENNKEIKDIDLVVKEDVKKANLLNYIKKNIKFITSGL